MNNFAGAHFGDAVVNLRKRDAVRDKAGAGQKLVAHHAQIARDVIRRAGWRPPCEPVSTLPKCSGSVFNGHFPSCAHHAEDHATTRVCRQWIGLLQNLRIARAVNHDIRRPAAEDAQRLRDKISLGGIDAVRRAEVAPPSSICDREYPPR